MIAPEVGFEPAAGTAAVALLVDALSIVLRATAIVMAAGAISIFARRSSAAVRHLIWALALAGTVALPLLTLALPEIAVRMPSRLAAASRIAPSIVVRLGEGSKFETAEADGTLAGVAAGPGEAGFRRLGSGGVEGSAAARARVGSARVPILILSVWFCGGLLVLALAGADRWRLRAVRRRARPVGERTMRLLDRLAADSGVQLPVRALTAPAAEVPATWGVFRPTLLLPDGHERWSDSRLTLVLRHELAHIRRRDYLLQCCAQLACAIYWFHPLVWVAARRLRIESEHACDDVVVRSGIRPTDYAHELVELAAIYSRRALARRVVPAVVGRTILRRRVVAVLDSSRARTSPRRGAALKAGLAAALVVAVSAAGSFVPAEPHEPDPPTSVLQHDFEALPGSLRVSTVPKLTPTGLSEVTALPGPPPGGLDYDFGGERQLFGRFVLEAIRPAVTAIVGQDEQSTANLARLVASRLWRTLAITLWLPEDAGRGPTIGITGNSMLDVNRTNTGALRIDLRALDGPFNEVLPRLVRRELGALLDLSSAEESALSEQLSRAGDILRAEWMDHLLKSGQS